MDFKTNAKCAGCSHAIKGALKTRFPNATFDLDLESADKVLHVHGIPEDSEHASQIIKTIEETGFKASWLTAGLVND